MVMSELNVVVSLQDRASAAIGSFNKNLDRMAAQARRAGVAMAAVGGAGIYLMERLTRAAAQGTAAEASFARMDASVKGLGDSIGTALLPVVVPLVETVANLAQKFAAWADAHPKLIAVIGGVVAGIGALGAGLLAFGTIVPAVTFGIAAIGAALAFLAANPVVLVIAGVAALAVAISTNFLGIRDIIGKALGFIFNLFDSWVGWLLPGGLIFKGIMFLKDNWRGVLNFMGEALETFVNFSIGGINKLIQGLNLIPFVAIPQLDKVNISFEGIADTLGDFGNRAREVFGTAAGGVKDWLAELGKAPGVVQQAAQAAGVAGTAQAMPGIQGPPRILGSFFDTLTGQRRLMVEGQQVFIRPVQAAIRSLEELRRESSIFAVLQEENAIWAESFAKGLLSEAQALQLITSGFDMAASAVDHFKEARDNLMKPSSFFGTSQAEAAQLQAALSSGDYRQLPGFVKYQAENPWMFKRPSSGVAGEIASDPGRFFSNAPASFNLYLNGRFIDVAAGEVVSQRA